MPRHENIRWSPAIELTKVEEMICARCKRTGRLFAFLRRHRHELFPEDFQAELAEIYADTPKGKPPVPPALLAMVTILQAAGGVSDAAAVEAAVFDRRWQMVLDCDGAETAPFSQGVLVEFRRRMLEHGKHLRLVEQSVAVARRTGGFGFKQLRVALDSAPLWGAGRVEDTFNLIAHALEVVVLCAAKAGGMKPEQLLNASGLKLIGNSSVKAALDIDWDDKDEQHRALQALLDEVDRLRTWLQDNLEEALTNSGVQEALEQLERVLQQDLEPDPDRGGRRITRGTSKDRQISITDPQMRHGRKSRSRTIEGYKRFIARELDYGLVLGVTAQPANQREHEATGPLREQVERFGEVEALYLDRGFLAGEWTKEAAANDVDIICRPWRVRNGDRYAKHEFAINLEGGTVRCPAGETTRIHGAVARFEASTCEQCSHRERCTMAKHGRSISIHPQEQLLQKLAAAKATPEGRAELRKRVPVEHGLAHICQRQGRRARYLGVDKNIFDLTRYAVIENLFVADRMERALAA